MNFCILLAVIVGCLYHVGLILRPKAVLPDRPFRDDAFYALTIARNFAIGNGFSTANGEIKTNGFQPLFVIISSIPYFLTSDKFYAIRIIHLIHFLVHIMSGVLVFYLLSQFSKSRVTPWIGFAFWIVSYNVLKLSSNGLETGFYLLMILLSATFYFTRILERQSVFNYIIFGTILGATTLTRIDAGFLCIAYGLHYVTYQKFVMKRSFKYMFGPIVLWFGTWLIITSPWWIYNYHMTGSIMPTSGLVQTLHYTTGQFFPWKNILRNLNYSITALLDQMSLFIVTPLRLIENVPHFSTIWNILRVIIVVAMIGFLFRKQNFESSINKNILIRILFYPLFVLMLLLYYNFYFNAAWYLNRYTIPCIILFVLFWPLWLERQRPVWTILFLLIGISLTLIIGGYSYNKVLAYTYRDHYSWVRDHVDENTWVAARQSGTLGYFHNKTLNMDGKVNSDIYRIAPDKIGDYLASKDVQYYIEWETDPLFKDQNFLENYEYLQKYGKCLIYKRKSMSRPAVLLESPVPDGLEFKYNGSVL